MNERIIEIRQKSSVYRLKPRVNESPAQAVERELGWALRTHMKYKTFESALDHLGWEMLVTTK
jgi:hypothetical protein